jgi:acyl dehydratase
VDAAADEVAYYEDIEVGERYLATETYRIDRAETLEFARKWDARSYHVDEQAARDSIFGGLVAPGALVIAIWTRLSLESKRSTKPWATLAGLGSELRMPCPVRIDDELSYSGEVTEKRLSQSRPGAGLVRMQHWLRNQNGEIVFDCVSTLLVERRDVDQPAAGL